MNTIEMHAIVHGTVQGVFFRETTKKRALEAEISGTVQNLPDGSVEIYAQGNRKSLEELIRGLCGTEGPGFVEKVDLSFQKPSCSYAGFQVIF